MKKKLYFSKVSIGNTFFFLYLFSNLGFVSPELNYLIKSGYYACSISAVVGAIISANQAKEDFMRRNTATQFESQHLGRVSIYIVTAKLSVVNSATQLN